MTLSSSPPFPFLLLPKRGPPLVKELGEGDDGDESVFHEVGQPALSEEIDPSGEELHAIAVRPRDDVSSPPPPGQVVLPHVRIMDVG